MLESEIEKKAGEVVRRRGGLWLKWVSPGMPGVPDRILISASGRIVFIELKQDRGRLSNIQRWMRDRLRAHGCDVRVAHGVTEVMAVVDEICPAPIPDGVHGEDQEPKTDRTMA